MNRWSTFFSEASEQSLFIDSVLVCTAVLVGLVVLFALFTVGIRLRRNHLEGRRKQMLKRWQPLLLEIINGDLPANVLHKEVQKGEKREFLEFIYCYARLLRGQCLERIRTAAVPYLDELHTVYGKKTPEHRARYVQIVGLMGEDRHVYRLVNALDDPSPLVAMMATRVLIRRSKAVYAEKILQRLHRFEDWSIDALAGLIASMGGGVSGLLRQVLADADQPVQVRTVAALALQTLNDAKAADLAACLLEQAAEQPLLRALLQLIGQVGKPRHLPQVQPFVMAASDAVRIRAVQALGQLSQKEQVEHLEEAVSDTSPWVARQAAQGLKRMGRSDVLRGFVSVEHPRSELAWEVLCEDHVLI